ncbi:hypothetical protein P170DRAFT_209545 [Aspergillus steynii IBT 23096]|uniref:Uncharacterized protein n=1 Tax=Aspergillus steynii IBT 23096 TaxID=1392250 RepID=A0A2I2G5Z8_9EURO|nr:uncharacterized protein P170DRAFT_209545 [Aspergillus steynii IBT 23096]PLB48273.1 hypothetical protein P170DRAFT_209545 [Aspergillus steynii IBT 23096]
MDSKSENYKWHGMLSLRIISPVTEPKVSDWQAQLWSRIDCIQRHAALTLPQPYKTSLRKIRLAMAKARMTRQGAGVIQRMMYPSRSVWPQALVSRCCNDQRVRYGVDNGAGLLLDVILHPFSVVTDRIGCFANYKLWIASSRRDCRLLHSRRHLFGWRCETMSCTLVVIYWCPIQRISLFIW